MKRRSRATERKICTNKKREQSRTTPTSTSTISRSRCQRRSSCGQRVAVAARAKFKLFSALFSFYCTYAASAKETGGVTERERGRREEREMDSARASVLYIYFGTLFFPLSICFSTISKCRWCKKENKRKCSFSSFSFAVYFSLSCAEIKELVPLAET